MADPRAHREERHPDALAREPRRDREDASAKEDAGDGHVAAGTRREGVEWHGGQGGTRSLQGRAEHRRGAGTCPPGLAAL